MYGVIGVDVHPGRAGFIIEGTMSPETHRDICGASHVAERNAGVFNIVAIVHICEKCGRITIPDTSRFDSAKCAKCGKRYRAT